MTTWKQIQNLVPQLGKPPDFTACLEAFPALEFAKTTPQSPVYHAEGDVWAHTMMVVESLLNMSDYKLASRRDQEITFLAALLHDIAKYSTTVIDPQTGHIGQPGHSRKGSIDARVALWDAGVPFAEREEICRIIAVHQVPFYALEGSRKLKEPEFIVRELSCQLNLHLLAMVAEADMLGRICLDQQKALDSIELFRMLAREDGCYGNPRDFVDNHTRLSYFRGATVHPDYTIYQEPGSKVIMLSGLPASGKNTYVDANYPQLPVVSFDDARTELGLKHGKNEGMVAHRAIDKAKELLRKKETFVWNATHLSQQMRDKTLNQLYAYNAEVELVYIEKPRSILLNRNSKRDTSLTNKSLEGMLVKWDLPTPTEAHTVRYIVENKD